MDWVDRAPSQWLNTYYGIGNGEEGSAMENQVPQQYEAWRSLPNLRIILVEPAGPLNIGAAARIMANMGFQRLVIVNPRCDPQGEEARRMAVHATDLLTAAQVVDSLPQALTGCVGAIATTARERDLHPPLELPEVALPWLIRPPEEEVALIFGPEDRGLSNEELNYAQRFIRIPSNPAYPSLNLAQAIAVCCYELRRILQGRTATEWAQSGTIHGPAVSPSVLPPFEKLEDFHQHLESVLLKIGYLYPHTADSRMEKFRRFFMRAAPTEQELAMLRGILSQIEWWIAQPPRDRPDTDSHSLPPTQH